MARFKLQLDSNSIVTGEYLDSIGALHVSTIQKPFKSVNLFNKYLTRNTSTAYDLNINGTSTGLFFDCPSPQGKTLHIYSSKIQILDAGISNSEFAGMGAPLTNGILVSLVTPESGHIYDLLDGVPIKQNSDFLNVAFTELSVTQGMDLIGIAWSHWHDGGPIHLKSNNIFRVTIRDDLSSIGRFRWMVHGLIFDDKEAV